MAVCWFTDKLSVELWTISDDGLCIFNSSFVHFWNALSRYINLTTCYQKARRFQSCEYIVTNYCNGKNKNWHLGNRGAGLICIKWRILPTGHVQYINILEWLRNFRVKITNFSSYFCLSISKRYLDTKKTEVCPENLGVMLEYRFLERGTAIASS